jgi:peptide-methionine (S)-S-oxide reductase
MALFGTKRTMVQPDEALPGRATPAFSHDAQHTVLGTPMQAPFPAGTEVLYVAAGCFWGVEEMYWALPGVYSTSVGYMGGFTPNPTYEEVCTGRTGHTEAVMIAFDPTVISVEDLLRLFWEHHDPTQVYRQGNDIGTQYRSAVFWTTPAQREAVEQTGERFQRALDARGFGAIATQVSAASDHVYYPAEGYHQQYLDKHPSGYRCHAATGILLPAA